MTRSHHAAPVDPERLTLADLRRALDKKESELRELLARRDALAHDLEELGETLQAMLAGSGAPPPRAARAPRAPHAEPAAEPKTKAKGHAPRKRAAPAVREGSLQTAIRAVLERVIGPLRVAEIVEAVGKSGYASKSAHLTGIVRNRHAQMEDVRRV